MQVTALPGQVTPRPGGVNQGGQALTDTRSDGRAVAFYTPANKLYSLDLRRVAKSREFSKTDTSHGNFRGINGHKLGILFIGNLKYS